MEQANITNPIQSRRSFLVGMSAVVGSAALGASLAAPRPAEATQEENAPAPSESYDCDIVVCGSGTAGLCAASHAAELGAKVILAEALTENGLGGNSKYVEACWLPPTEEKAQKAYIDMIEYHKNACNTHVLRKFCNSARDLFDWTVNNQKVQFQPLSSTRSTARYLKDEKNGWNGGKAAVMTMYQYCLDLGVEFIFDARAREAITDSKGSVIGVICERLAGSRLQINAKSVVLATGGYSANKDLFEEFTHQPYDRFIPYGSSGSQKGDGITIGRSLGAALHHPEAINYFSPVLPGHFNKGALTVCGANQADTCFFNEDGRRFCDESCISDNTLSGNIGAQQAKIFVVIDTDFVKKIESEGPVTKRTNYFDANVPVPGFGAELEAALSRENPRVVKADTISELAKLLEVDGTALEDEIKKWNGYVDNQNDPEFCKPANLMRKIQTPPFYGLKTVLSWYNNVGGLKVDSDARVIDLQNKPINGLYAAASDAGALFGSCYDIVCAPGSTQMWARMSGYWAAEHAVNVFMPALES